MLRPAEVMDNPGGGEFFLLIPDILGQLVISDCGAVFILTVGLSQVHVQNISMYYYAMSRDKSIFVCL